jgi:head-tail adaptor
MNADHLRHPLTLQQQDLTQEEFGQMNGQWVEVSRERASIEGASSWSPVPNRLNYLPHHHSLP